MAALEAQRVTGPWETEMTRLRTQYQAAIDREIAARQKAAALDDIVVLRAEKQRIADGQDPIGDESTDPPQLVALRKVWRTAAAKAAAARDAARSTLQKQYDTALRALETTLTRAGRVDDALAARTQRETLAARIVPSDSAPATSDATAAAPATGRKTFTVTPATPADKVRPATTLSARDLASRIRLARDARIEITPQKGAKRAYGQWNADASLPDGDFAVTTIEVYADPPDGAPALEPAWLTGHVDLERLRLSPKAPLADFSVLRGFKDLQSLYLPAAHTDAHILTMPPLPGLRVLEIRGTFTDAAVAHIADRAPDVSDLTLASTALTADAPVHLFRHLRKLTVGAGILRLFTRPIPELKNLTDLTLTGGGATPREMPGLQIPPDVETLTFRDVRWSDDGYAVALAAKPPCRRLVFWGCGGIGPAALKAIPVLPEIEGLSFRNSGLPDSAAAAMPALGKVKSLDLTDSTRRWPEPGILTVISRFPALERLYLENNPELTDAFAAALAQSHPRLTKLGLGSAALTDACLPALASFRKLESLLLFGGTFTAAGLAEIRKVRTLTSLDVHSKAFPRDALEAFRRERPDVKVIVR